MLYGVGEAAADVILQQQETHLVGRGGERLHLLQEVQAVGLFLHQSLQAAGLALDPPQAGDEVALVLRVAVAEMGGMCIGGHTGGQYVGDGSPGQSG